MLELASKNVRSMELNLSTLNVSFAVPLRYGFVGVQLIFVIHVIVLQVIIKLLHVKEKVNVI